MKLREILRKNSISFFIYFVLLFIAGNGLLDYYQRATLEKHELVAEQVKNGRHYMDQLLRNLNLLDLGVRGFYIIPKEELLLPYNNARENFPQEVENLKVIMEEQGISTRDFAPVEKVFRDYIALMEEMVEWRKAGRLTEIDSVINSDPGYGVWITYEKFNKNFQEQQDAIFRESQAKTSKIVLISTIIRISLLVFGIPTLFIVLYRLGRERSRRKKLFLELDQNNKQYLFDPKTENEKEPDEKSIISSLIANLRQASEFISSIAKGEFDAKWAGLTEKNQEANKDNLVGELWKMRDQMIRVKQEDQVRLWVTEGISKFSEIVRNYQDNVELLSDKLTANVVKYLKANQASLFFAVEEDNGKIVLELSGCYAYDRKKYQQKVIVPGQGLVGQTYLEKEVTFLTDIPPNYVQITSGLGKATPTSIVIVPLKFNDSVEGILEIASFSRFQPYEIEFLEKIGEIIASAIVSLRASVKMKKLMDSMQIQSEELKAQEEEMRQNMEELQATQEEMHRKTKEYQELLEERNVEIRNYVREIQSLQKQLKEAGF